MRRTAEAALLAAVLLPLSALAQPQSDVEQQWVDGSGRGSLLVGNGRTLPAGHFRAGTTLFFTQGNLATYSNGASPQLLSERLGAQVFGAVGLTDWLEVSANAPVIIEQRGAQNLGLAPGGLGNPWLTVTGNILGDARPVQLNASLGLGVPIGTGAAQGNGGLEVAPRLTAGRLFDDYHFGLELAGLVRPTVSYGELTGRSGDEVGSQISVAAMVATVNQKGPRGEASARGFVPLTGGRAGVELQVGFRWPLGEVEVYGSAGPGFFGEPSTPTLRAYLGVAFSDAPLTQPPCVEGKPYLLERCPLLDRDGDGVMNGVDLAPLSPEDKDGYQDEDGVPDEDDDGDGVKDVVDRCPRQEGPEANQGCPDTDADNDGIVDRKDGCKDQPEDVDAWEDQDGCPDPDNDGDGILDEVDACPMQAGIIEEKGCPMKDSDGDTVPDFADNCPAEAGEPANQGCPAAQKQLVVITRERLVILDKVYFNTGKATIQKRSNLMLDQIANVLNAHPEIPLVQVEGHTDNVGKPEKNKTLSQARADAVRAYLVKKGVAEARLRAVGFGQDKPAEPNDTPAGREANRRVEFNIIHE